MPENSLIPLRIPSSLQAIGAQQTGCSDSGTALCNALGCYKKEQNIFPVLQGLKNEIHIQLVIETMCDMHVMGQLVNLYFVFEMLNCIVFSVCFPPSQGFLNALYTLLSQGSVLLKREKQATHHVLANAACVSLGMRLNLINLLNYLMNVQF